MGFGLPAAIAASLARPGRLGIALAGDGGFAMTMAELETAVRERAHVIALVFDNGRYGTIWRHQEQRGGEGGLATSLGPIDFAEVANAAGALGLTVSTDSEFEPALRQAMEAGRPAVLHLALDPSWTTPEAAAGEVLPEAIVEVTPPSTVEEALIEEAVEEAVEAALVEEAVVEEVLAAEVEEAVEEAVEAALVEEAVVEAVEEALIEEAVVEEVLAAEVEQAVEEAVEEALIEEAVEEAVEAALIEEIIAETVAEAEAEAEAEIPPTEPPSADSPTE
jgi:hypothetical protein